nr:hypothetical protein [Tanacetum cinerariifolium]
QTKKCEHRRHGRAPLQSIASPTCPSTSHTASHHHRLTVAPLHYVTIEMLRLLVARLISGAASSSEHSFLLDRLLTFCSAAPPPAALSDDTALLVQAILASHHSS